MKQAARRFKIKFPKWKDIKEAVFVGYWTLDIAQWRRSFKQKHIDFKYRLFLLDRKILHHRVFRYIYPKPGFARRLVAGMLAFTVLGTGLVVYYKPGKADAAWYSDVWQYRKEIIIDHTKVANTDQTNFPLLINITDSGLANHAQSDGDDILFTSSDGSTKLSHETETYDSGTGKLVSWVKIPSLSASNDTVIYMYYGNPAASSQQDVSNVWDSEMVEVQHFEETGACPVTFTDTKGNANGSCGAGSPDSINAQIGYGRSLSGSSEFITITGDITNNFARTQDFTVSFWVKNDTGNVDGDRIIERWFGTNGYPFTFRYNSTNSSVFFGRYDLTHTPGVAGTTSIDDGNWHMVTGVKNGSSLTIYIDGANAGSATDTTTGTTTNSQDLYIGAQGNNSNHYHGEIDEMQISDNNRSADWIATQYNNQSDPGSFYSIEVQEGPDEASPKLYWNFDEGKGPIAGDSGDHENTGVTSANWKNKEACLFGGSCLQFSNNNGNMLLSDGFESGGLGSWTVTNVTADTITMLDGNYSAKITNNGSAVASNATQNITSQTAAYVGAYVNITDGTSSTDLIGFKAGSDVFTLYRQQGGKLCLWNGTTSTGTCSERSIPLDEWHRYDFYLSISSSVGIMRAYVDGVLVPDLNLTGLNTGTTSLSAGQIGVVAVSRTFTAYIDDFSVSTAPITYVRRDYNGDEELDPEDNSFTVSAWFKHPSSVSGTDTIIARSNGAVNGIGYKIYMDSSGKICFGIDNDGTSFPEDDACSTSSYTDSYWHHVEAVKNGTTSITLYIDGKQVDQDGTISATGSLSGSSPTFYIGIDGDGASNPWDGFIDEVKYYHYAKTAEQVKADYNAKGSVLGASVVFGAGDAANSVNQGLVGYWNMDDDTANPCASGSNRSCDGSGNGNDGIWAGNATNTSGKFGLATTYDGTGDYDSVTHNSAFDFGANQNFSVGVWVKSTQAAAVSKWPLIVSKEDGSVPPRTGYNIGLHNSNIDSRWYFELYSNGTSYLCQGANDVADGKWHHLLGVRRGSDIFTYEDGVFATKCSATTASVASSSSLVFGSGGTSSSGVDFNGTIDDVRIYNRPLSDREARSLSEWAPLPVGWWKFDERTGTTASDLSGNGNTATMSGSPVWTNGKYGAALNFDGTSAWLGLHAPKRIPSGDVPRSISAWFKTTDSTEFNNIGGFGTNATGANFQVGADRDAGTGTWKVWGWGGGEDWDTGISNNTYADGVWHHVSVTYDGTTTKIYFDGVLKASTASFNWVTNPLKVIIGNEIDEAGHEFDGNIDDFRVYNYARTTKQIVKDMNGGHPSVGTPVGSPVGHWSFDEAYGTTANDKTPLENDLTLSLASWTTSGRFNKAWNGAGTNWLCSQSGGTCADEDDFDFAAADDMAVTMWFRSDSATNPGAIQYLVDKQAGIGYSLYVRTDGRVCFGIDDDAGFTPDDEVCSVADIYDKQWHHVVATMVGTSKIQLFVDGRLNTVDAAISATGTLANSAVLYLGDDDGDSTNAFAGDIDETKIYRFALNSDEVMVEYNQAKGVVLGALSAAPDGSATNSAARYFCPPGDGDGNCAAASDPSPVAYWKLDEGTGTTANDSGTRGIVGTLTSSPTWTPGKIGRGVTVNGSSSYINIPTNSALHSNSEVTVSAWVNLTSGAPAQSEVAVVLGASGSRLTFVAKRNATGSFFAYWDTNNLWKESGLSLTRSQWYHLVWVVKNNNYVKFYANGEFLSNQSLSSALPTLDGSAKLGWSGAGSEYLKGSIDDVKIYNYERTPRQITWDYNRGRPTSWWKFDECSGTTLNDSALAGSGLGTGLTGTLTNATAGTCEDNASTSWYEGRTGKFNASLDLDGSNDVVAVSNASAIDLNEGLANGFTVSTWVNADSDGEGDQGQIFNKGTNTYCRTKNQIGNHLDLECKLDLATTDALITVGNAFDIGGWHNVVLSWTDDSDDEVSVWIDGRLRGVSIVGNGSNAAESNSLIIGGSSSAGATAFEGKIDQVMIFPYELTFPMIQVLYNENSAVRIGPSTGTP